jgi:PIN domain nuclease of toxin-antitoxin system
MKGLILGSLSMLIVTVASPLSANAATPINLVNLARNGYFQERGIPSHSALKRAIALGEVKGEKLVQAAIEANRIDAQLLNDNSYVRSVDQQLDLLIEAD